MHIKRIAWSVLWLGLLSAQELYIRDEVVYISAQDTVSVIGAPPGDLQVDGTGIIENDGGVVWLTGDWINSSQGDGFVTPRNGWLYLVGGYQRLVGPTPTFYNSLALFNNGGDIKEMIGADGRIQNFLVLNDCELRTNAQTMMVENTDPAAITRTSGFVSSTGNGRLGRRTDRVASYLFPVGDRQLGPFRYRPVEVTPSAAAHTFLVRFANTDPTTDGFDRRAVLSPIDEANEFFYHIIERAAGNDPITLRIWYDEANDTYKDTLAHWEVPAARWEAMPTVINRSTGVAQTGMTQSAYMESSGWTNFSSPNFALARTRAPFVIYVPTVFSPNGDGSNDEFLIYYRGFERVRLRIYDRWGLLIWQGEQVGEGPIRWNGLTQRGETVPEDAYVFVVTGYLRDGRSTERAGTVTVIR
ncbi:MAG: gliding motility-associated C-terminal domain-containing protein [Bacteroidia bacterium]|nr:gliding motility-associated C-terminal domain-containing protein [Bacteroidia bacterium]MCX7764376.1 gliding motility-associated C-terminal domain-containing protein [Bacteroidia bacterium]MDW8057928.1 gliding motility-associated C-terminal domain-containing protein [Bacteroidia bacterium]